MYQRKKTRNMEGIRDMEDTNSNSQENETKK